MQAQADFLDVYRRTTNAANEALKLALRNMEQLGEQHRQWVRAAMEQSDRLANRLAEAKTIDDVFVAQSHFAFSLLTQAIEGWWPLNHKRAGSWNGIERRKGSVVLFTGPERRKAG